MKLVYEPNVANSQMSSLLYSNNTQGTEEAYGSGDSTSDISQAVFLGDIFQAISFIIVLIPGVPLNILAVVLIIKYKSLQQCRFFVAFQIFCSNIVLLVFLMPVSAVSSIAHGWVFGDILCDLTAFLIEWMRALRFFLTLVLALDCSFSVYFPLHFCKWEVRFVTVTSVLAWIAALVLSALPLTGLLDCYNYSPFIKYCFIGPPTILACDILVRVSIYTQYTAGGLVPLILYVALYCKARKVARKIKSDNRDSQTQGGVQHVNAVSRRRQKATFLLLVFNVFGLSLPHFILFNIINLLSARISIPIELILFTNIFVRFFFILVPVIDPLTIMKNTDVRKVLVKIKQSFRGSKVTPNFTSETNTAS